MKASVTTSHHLAKPLILASIIGAIGLIICAILLSDFFVGVRMEKSVTVKGFAERPLRSAIGKISCTISASAFSPREALKRVDEKIQELTPLIEREPFSVDMQTPSFSTTYQRDSNGNRLNVVDYYSAQRYIVMTSEVVEAIPLLAERLLSYMDGQAMVRVGTPEYLLGNLDQHKKELIELATRNGRQRAEILAQNSGADIADLVAARQGVIQITEPHSTRTESYGVYDTSTIDKVMKVVVSLDYAIR